MRSLLSRPFGGRGYAAALLIALLAFSVPLSAALEASGDLATRLDRRLAAAYPAGEPGAAVLIEKDGGVVLRKGYGMASLELGVLVKPEMAFRIGSITKQ